MKPIAGRIRRLWPVIRVVWIVAGLVFLIWLYDSFSAKGVDESILQSDGQIRVVDTDGAITFTPKEANPSIGLLFFHGGGVEPLAYAPLIRAVAEKGYSAVIVKLPYRFAPLDSHRHETIRRGRSVIAQSTNLRKWVVAGHSKGGKIAAEFVRSDRSSVGALILIATSHPKDFDLSGLTIPVKKISASNDGVAPPPLIQSTKRYLPAGTQWVEIVGGNHSQFGHYGPQFGDGSATIDRAEQQRRTRDELLATLDALQAGAQ